MSEIIIITPVKDSPETTKKTIEAISKAHGDFEYYVFNDFSKPETKLFLEKAKKKYHFHLIHLEEITSTPSPNYKLILEKAQAIALQKGVPLLIVESDVIIEKNTVVNLLEEQQKTVNPGLIGAITVDQSGAYNFPYTFGKTKSREVVNTHHSLSFCCTLLTHNFLQKFNFKHLSDKKDWFDVHISHEAKKLGFENYLAKYIEVVHLPHSSRPWKNLKYNNPLLYYLKKYFYKRDRI